jgi:hypothetical protein
MVLRQFFQPSLFAMTASIPEPHLFPAGRRVDSEDHMDPKASIARKDEETVKSTSVVG